MPFIPDTTGRRAHAIRPHAKPGSNSMFHSQAASACLARASCHRYFLVLDRCLGDEWDNASGRRARSSGSDATDSARTLNARILAGVSQLSDSVTLASFLVPVSSQFRSIGRPCCRDHSANRANRSRSMPERADIAACNVVSSLYPSAVAISPRLADWASSVSRSRPPKASRYARS